MQRGLQSGWERERERDVSEWQQVSGKRGESIVIVEGRREWNIPVPASQSSYMLVRRSVLHPLFASSPSPLFHALFIHSSQSGMHHQPVDQAIESKGTQSWPRSNPRQPFCYRFLFSFVSSLSLFLLITIWWSPWLHLLWSASLFFSSSWSFILFLTTSLSPPVWPITRWSNSLLFFPVIVFPSPHQHDRCNTVRWNSSFAPNSYLILFSLTFCLLSSWNLLLFGWNTGSRSHSPVPYTRWSWQSFVSFNCWFNCIAPFGVACLPVVLGSRPGMRRFRNSFKSRPIIVSHVFLFFPWLPHVWAWNLLAF